MMPIFKALFNNQSFARSHAQHVESAGFRPENRSRTWVSASNAALAVCFAAAMWASPQFSHAATPLFDGSFESGTFQGWQPGGSGSAMIATQSTCFAGGDTTGLRFEGSYAGLLRSKPDSKEDFPYLTSRTFTAGRGIAFRAISELRGNRPKGKHPFALKVHILDGSGNALREVNLATQLVALNHGCPSQPVDQSASPLFISTAAFAGRPIKLRFSHHPDYAPSGGFTLIDALVRFEMDEIPNYDSNPFAIAGVDRTDSGALMLTTELPAEGAGATYDWQYSWYIDGESDRRYYYNPCIDDLAPGNYTATLYITAGGKQTTDTIRFIVPADEQSEEESEDGDDTDEEENGTEEQCNVAHPTDLPEKEKEEGEEEEEGKEEEDGNTDDETESPQIELTLLPLIDLLEETNFIDSVEITQGATSEFQSGLITLAASGGNDTLIKPADGVIDSRIDIECNDSATRCELTSNEDGVDDNAYETAFEAFKINLDLEEDEQAVITVTVVDSNENSDSDSDGYTYTSILPQVEATTNSPFEHGQVLDLFNSLSITTFDSAKISSASVELTSYQADDTLVDPPVSTTPTTSCSSKTKCTWSGDNLTSVYASAISALRINLMESDQKRTVTLTVTDDQNRSDTVDYIIESEEPES